MIGDTGVAIEPFHGRQVEALAGYGISEDEIAHLLRVGRDDLLRLYPAELKDGCIKANS